MSDTKLAQGVEGRVSFHLISGRFRSEQVGFFFLEEGIQVGLDIFVELILSVFISLGQTAGSNQIRLPKKVQKT